MIARVASTSTIVRAANSADRQALQKLIQTSPALHQHLDWRQPLDWIDCPPFLVMERLGRIVAALACPPDPPEVAWFRLFACQSGIPPTQAWAELWPPARDVLQLAAEIQIASVALEEWYQPLLEKTGFRRIYDVVMLSWENHRALLPAPGFQGTIREIRAEDLAQLAVIDALAFAPLWRNSLDSIRLAYQQAAIATLVEDESGIVGFQISTYNPLGGHLARLAVLPERQVGGIGYALVLDLLRRFRERGALRVTVNTQENNAASLALYRKANFHRTREAFPIYCRNL